MQTIHTALQGTPSKLPAIVIKQRPTPLVLAVGAGLLLISLACFLFMGSYTRRVTTSGILAPSTGIIRMRAASPGHVAGIYVKEGQIVKKGQPLFALEDSRGLVNDALQTGAAQQPGARRLTDALADSLSRRGQSMELERANRIAVQRQDVLSLDMQLAQGKDELASATKVAQLSQSRAAQAMEQANMFDDLSKKGYFSSAALHDKRDIVTSLQVAAADALRNVETLKRQLGALESSRAQIAAKAELELIQIEQRQAMLQQDSLELSNRKSSVLVAPIDGRVTAVLVDIGTFVEGQVTATIVPSNVALLAFLYVPSRAVGFIRSGQTVKLRYEAFPYQKFGIQEGRVLDVSLAQIAPDQIPESLPLQSREGLYRVTVSLDSQYINAYLERKPLIAGMVVEADLMQENRTLIEWILEPLIATKARFTSSQPGARP